MAGYTKLFSTILASSIWSEDDKTRIMWITMLASADADGYVSGSIPGMADIARMSIQQAQRAIDKLCSPDPYSRSDDCDGRRLLAVPGGWQITNYPKYRDKQDLEERRRQVREAVQRHRQRKKASDKGCNHGVIKCNAQKSHAEAEAEALKDKDLSGDSDKMTFDKARKTYPGTKRGLNTEFANFQKKHKDWREVLPDLLPAIGLIQHDRDEKLVRKEFVPAWANFSTWINNRRWEEAENVEV